MNAVTEIEDEAGPSILSALPQVLWQRRWLIIIPAVLALIGGIVAAAVIPPMYESSATVLIESQQMAVDAVSSANSVNDMIEQRIARARERVLSRKDLIRLIREDNLYPEKQRTQPLSEIVEEMRNDTTISAVPLDIGGGARSAYGSNTIALRISFSYREPAKTQIVAQQYVNNFLEVDAASQTDRATNAAAFLAQKQSELANQINEIENRVSRIKQENGAVLAMVGQSTGNPMADASRIDSQIAALQADNARQNMAGGGDPAVAQAEAALRVAQARFSPTHPDVIAAKAQLDAAKAAASPGAGAGANPVVAANRAQIASLQQAKALLMSDSVRARAAASQGPVIAGQIAQLEKQADDLREQYRTISAKNLGADINKSMVTEQKGERLTLADPPVVPDQPYRPNRPVIVIGALAAGIGLGLALTLAFELLFHPIRGAEQLKIACGQAPIAIIPDFARKPHVIIRWLEARNRKRSKRE